MKNENMTKERYLEIIANFKAFVNDIANKPYYDKEYGTKHQGNITFAHFVFYALVRGKNPEITTHDVESEKYLHVLELLRTMSKPNYRDSQLRHSLRVAMGLTDEEITSILSTSI
ncbi:hypothetical protein QTV43_000613 [Vibrio vulnificus]|nr:hypothetical protein [Vibrio vulnificus]